MPDLLTFGPTPKIERLGTPVVYTRTRWADPWVEQDWLLPDEVTWQCSHAMPTATCVWRYGLLAREGEPAADLVERLDWHPGRYVKIEVPCDLDEAETAAEGQDVFFTRTWYGEIQQIVDDQHGLFEAPAVAGPGGAPRIVATGQQRLICLGIGESLLSRHRIRSCSFDRGGGITGNETTIPFNLPSGRGNRGLTEYGDPGDASYVFYYDLDGGAANVSTWSTREIVRYLLRRQTPRDHLGARQVYFRVHADSLARLPNWDLPYLDQDNATTLALLQRLIDRRRLLSFWFDVVTDGGIDWVELHVDSIVPNDVQLTIAPTAKILAASRQLTCNYDQDQATRGHVRDSEIGIYDRVIARGAKIVYVGSFSVADGSLQKAWRPGDQTLYEYGATGTAGFATAGLGEKQRRHTAARSDPRLEDVFCRFRIPPDWDQKVGDGFGGVEVDLFASPLGPTPSYYPSITLRPSLPLYPKVDYSLDAVRLGTSIANEPKGDVDLLPVQSYWRRPKADSDGVFRWFRGDEMGRLARMAGVDPEDAERITITTHVQPRSHSIVFRVGGAAQHEIAHGAFNPTTEDRAAGQWSYLGGKSLVTLAVENGLRVEGQFPLFGPFGRDHIRTLVIDAGDHFERVYIAPLTVVGLSAGGQLVRSNGGWLDRPEGVVTRLEDLAHLAHAWYSIPHQVLTIETQRLLSHESITLGDLVVDVGDAAIEANPAHRTVNASVTSITIRWEESVNTDEPPAPSMTIQTFAGELDALAVGPAGFEGAGNPFRTRRTIKL